MGKIKVYSKGYLKELIDNILATDGITADLNILDVSGVTDMSYLFSNSIFNGDISNWDVSNVKNMRGMFQNSQFNGDISKWNVSNVENVRSMFEGSLFNGDISQWNVGNVEYMCAMFAYSKFNQDISNWDVSNVKDMRWLFEGSIFTGNISNWNVDKVVDMRNMFKKSFINENSLGWKIGNRMGVLDMSNLVINQTKNNESQLNVVKTKETIIPTFDQTFLDIAEVIAKRSKSTRLKVGAVLVKDNRIIATGYNGLVSGVDPDILEDDNGMTKPDVIHAELNCIISCAKNGVCTDGSILYITHSPCESCAALIAQSGISKVIYKNEYRKREGIENLKTYNVDVIKY
jgi:surface protein